MNKKHEYKTFEARKGSGGVLVVVALSLLVLVGAMGFATDMYLMTTTRTQYQGIADRLALAVLEAYLYEDAAGSTTAEALDSAASRAQALLGDNVKLLITRSHLTGTGNQDDIQMNTTGDTAGGLNGYIQPGRWFTSNPECAGTAPIFCPLSSAQITSGSRPNSFRVNVGINPNAPIKTVLLKLIGQKSYKSNAIATAALTPRRAVFLIDLSASIHDITHNAQWNNTMGPGEHSLYAYRLRTGISCAFVGTPIAPADILDLADPAESFSSYFTGISPTSNPRDIYAALAVNRGGSTGAEHYRDDFSCFDVDSDGDGSNDESYAIDTYRLPQPLTDILNGIHTAMIQFQSRAVAGDQIMIAGFDDEVMGNRTTNNGGSPLLPIMVAPSVSGTTHPEYQRILDATANIPAGSHIGSYFFPRQWGRYGPDSPYLTSVDPNLGGVAAALAAQWDLPDTPLPPLPAQTNIAQALDLARRALKTQPNWESSDNFVVIFSDGLSNCPSGGYLRAWGLYSYCSSTNPNFYQTGVNSVRDTLFNHFFPDNSLHGEKIAVHFVISGKTSKPHLLIRPGLNSNNGFGGNAAGCLTDAQARKLPGFFQRWTGQGSLGAMINYTHGSNFPSSYPYPNILREDIAKTNGLWVPLRSPCSSAGSPINNGWGSFSDLENLVESRCQSSTTLGDYTDFGQAAHLQPGEYENFPWDTNGDGTSSFASRIYCDIKGRSTATQVTELFDKIMSANPYVLVQ